MAERSRRVHDAWYEELAHRIAPMAAQGPFVVYDLHSYNHRRDGPDAGPAPQEGNPDVNVGTGSLDREPWIPLVDAFTESMSTEVIPATGRRLDVRENVRFWGQNEGRWAHRMFRDTACILALEFKKTFMDEWTGEVDEEHLAQLAEALDVRLFLLNGRPLTVNGKTAAFRRRNTSNDVRSNMSAGGNAEPVDLTDEMLHLVEVVRPKLVSDGMFLVGLDIVGDKLMEINVFSPGGLDSCQSLYGEDFAVAVIADLERKMDVRRHYGDTLQNARLATI